jgi:hypothetical protein
VTTLNRVRDAVQVLPVVIFIGLALMATSWRRVRSKQSRAAATTAVIAVVLITIPPAVARLFVARAASGAGDPSPGVAALAGDVTEALVAAVVRAAQLAGAFVLGLAAIVAVLALSRCDRRDLRGSRRTSVVSRRGVALASVPLVVCGVAVGGAAASESPATAARCNGHVALCTRSYDSVTFAATHNSMAAAGEFWFPYQDSDIAAQLDGGVRALLIDTHEWEPVVPRSELGTVSKALAAADADLRHALAPLARSQPGSYLCHRYCALGASPLTEELRVVAEFLDAHPRDVVTLIIEDGIPVDETRRALADAGLTQMLHRHELGEGWPTLGELIASGERLVVFEESRDDIGARAFDHMEETPYRVEDPSELSCDPQRGGTDKPLFLMNHWIERSVPDRVDATTLNGRDLLLQRVRECSDVRGKQPNFIAVNFVEIGDVVAVVEELNGFGASS